MLRNSRKSAAFLLNRQVDAPHNHPKAHGDHRDIELLHETLHKLKKAMKRKDPDDFEEALSACFPITPCDGLCDLLTDALLEDWHFRHEDVVLAIQGLQCEGAVQALERRAIASPEYLQWDENHALARKCTWALADIGTAASRDALERLAGSENLVIGVYAQKRLDRWELEMARKGN